jgi:hypothetical protein
MAPPSSANPLSMAINQNNDIWLGTDWGIYLSTDNGITWTDKGLPQKIVNAVLIHSNGNIFLATQFNGILCSTDEGNSWGEKNNGISSVDYFSALAENPKGDLFAGTAADGIYRSLDTANTWVEIDSGLTNLKINSIAVKNQEMLFVATHGGGVFRSSDNGESWIQKINGLTNLYVRSLAISGSGQIVAATFAGAFKSTDDGETWVAINEGLSNTHLNSIIIDQGGYLFAGALTSGAFRSVNSIMGIDDIPLTVSILCLNQNYPNPFNTNTRITWYSAASCRQTLKLFDVRGNYITTLVDEYKPAGNFEVEFSAGKRLAPGIYYYSLQAGNIIQTRKMVLMK